MRKLITGVLLLVSFFASSQKLVFNYDESGNQIQRKKTAVSSRIVSNELTASTKAIKEDDATSNDFIIYPNPTQGPITLRWTEEYKGKIAYITLSDMAGHKEEIEFKPNTIQVEIDLTTYPQGVYIINFHLKKGKRIDKKIIKQN